MKYLICNLKAHKTFNEILLYREELLKLKYPINLIIAPSNIYLNLFRATNYDLCVQNIDLHENLELTGDTSIKQLKSLNIKYCLVGHYERRNNYEETEYDIIKKINNALNNNLKVIYCIGETLEELERKIEYQKIQKSLFKVLNNVPKTKLKDIIIAYEPAYLIGQNTNYNINKIQETISFIKQLINDYFDSNINIVFGGNINIKNINDLLETKNLDGFIIGSASLNVENIDKLLQKITATS